MTVYEILFRKKVGILLSMEMSKGAKNVLRNCNILYKKFTWYKCLSIKILESKYLIVEITIFQLIFEEKRDFRDFLIWVFLIPTNILKNPVKNVFLNDYFLIVLSIACTYQIESYVLKSFTWIFSAKISSRWFYRVLTS